MAVESVPEAEKFKIKAPTDSMSGESPLLGSKVAIFLLCPQVAEGAIELSGACFMMSLIPFSGFYPRNRTHP